MGRFVIGILITMIVFLGGPFLFEYLGWIPGLQPSAALILCVTGGGFVFKQLFTKIAAGEFTYEKFGFDNCTLAFGGFLTAFVFQLTSQTDHFPGTDATILKYISLPKNTIVGNRQLQLLFLLFVVLGFTLGTALIVRHIKESDSKVKGLWALISAIAGIFILGLYILILVLKSE